MFQRVITDAGSVKWRDLETTGLDFTEKTTKRPLISLIRLLERLRARAADVLALEKVAVGERHYRSTIEVSLLGSAVTVSLVFARSTKYLGPLDKEARLNCDVSEMIWDEVSGHSPHEDVVYVPLAERSRTFCRDLNSGRRNVLTTFAPANASLLAMERHTGEIRILTPLRRVARSEHDEREAPICDILISNEELDALLNFTQCPRDPQVPPHIPSYLHTLLEQLGEGTSGISGVRSLHTVLNRLLTAFVVDAELARRRGMLDHAAWPRH